MKVEFTGKQGFINHIGFVLDESLSMSHLADDLIKVADNQIEHLAAASKAHDQETRASVYTFNTGVKCAFYDKDVLRLPSLKGLYRPSGRTALVSATMEAIRELEQTATLHGDHSFLLFVLTDGGDNESSEEDREAFPDKLANLPDNWTISLLAPDSRTTHYAKMFGFPGYCIERWDYSAAGVEEVGRKMARATDAYMTMRSTGGKVGKKSVFSLDNESVKSALIQGDLRVLANSAYKMLSVPRGRGLPAEKLQIADFVESDCGLRYEKGCAYYQLVKTKERPSELVQYSKRVAIRKKDSGNVYVGDVAREMLGLPEYAAVRIKAEDNPDYDVFIQSSSVNRHLVGGTSLLYMKP